VSRRQLKIGASDNKFALGRAQLSIISRMPAIAFAHSAAREFRQGFNNKLLQRESFFLQRSLFWLLFCREHADHRGSLIIYAARGVCIYVSERPIEQPSRWPAQRKFGFLLILTHVLGARTRTGMVYTCVVGYFILLC